MVFFAAIRYIEGVDCHFLNIGHNKNVDTFFFWGEGGEVYFPQ